MIRCLRLYFNRAEPTAIAYKQSNGHCHKDKHLKGNYYIFKADEQKPTWGHYNEEGLKKTITWQSAKLRAVMATFGSCWRAEKALPGALRREWSRNGFTFA